MLSIKKSAKQLEVSEFKIGKCPICSSYISHVYFMQDSKTKQASKWYSCFCGVVFQDKFPDKIYDKKYADDFSKCDSKIKDSFEYPVRIYAPIIEELIYGRRILIVGSATSHQREVFKSRGWVPTVIDKNPHSSADIKSDFEEYKFPENVKYNLIWLYGTLECFSNPIGSLALCDKLLVEDGILFIATPDTDFIHTRASAGFIHWKSDMHYLMWNRQSLTYHLGKLGYNTILCRQNYEPRFPDIDVIHLIAQRRFF